MGPDISGFFVCLFSGSLKVKMDTLSEKGE